MFSLSLIFRTREIFIFLLGTTRDINTTASTCAVIGNISTGCTYCPCIHVILTAKLESLGSPPSGLRNLNITER